MTYDDRLSLMAGCIGGVAAAHAEAANILLLYRSRPPLEQGGTIPPSAEIGHPCRHKIELYVDAGIASCFLTCKSSSFCKTNDGLQA